MSAKTDYNKTASSLEYHPERYWSEVARRIGERGQHRFLAGDDEPYYRYKRKRFLRLLNSIDFIGKDVLEVGCGPGGNLMEVLSHAPASLTGADISAEMIELAGRAVKGLKPEIRLVKTDGHKLPFEDGSFDIVFTATVLQHNTDENMLRPLLAEICRVSSSEVILLERIEKTEKGDDLCMGRTLEQYQAICRQQGFSLQSVDYINTRVSYLISGAIRKVFNRSSRKEAESVSAISEILQILTLPITRPLDKIFTSPTDVAMMCFTKDRIVSAKQ